MYNIKIHKTRPLSSLRLNYTMQDIVYKLAVCKMVKKSQFGNSAGPEPGQVTQPSGAEPAPSNFGLPFSSFHHSKAHDCHYDEQLSLSLEQPSSGKDKNKSVL